LAKIVLEAYHLVKRYKSRYAVNDVSFQVLEGEIFGFLGPNGAGKSTVIKMITGLAKPDSGEIKICGYSVSKQFEKAIKCLGGIIETPVCYNYMTGMQNLKFYAGLYKHIDNEKIDNIVKLVGLENRINEKVKNYSLGMKQRLGIAQSLLHNPKILILDEPTNGLDPNGILEMRKFLKHIAQKWNISIMISSHILAEMELICDTIAIIDNGELKEIKTVKELTKGKYDQSKIAIKVNYPNYAGKLIIEKFQCKVELAGSNVIVYLPEKDIPTITTYLVQKRIAVFGISKITKTLEQVFLDVINSDNSDDIRSIN